MPLELKETNIANEHNRLKNSNWRGQTSWLFTSGVYRETAPASGQSGT